MPPPSLPLQTFHDLQCDGVNTVDDTCLRAPSAPPVTTEWTASAWLSSVDVGTPVADALLGQPRPADELAAIRRLAVATSHSETALTERLRASGVLEALAKALLPKLQALAETATVTGAELSSKFVQESAAIAMKHDDFSERIDELLTEKADLQQEINRLRKKIIGLEEQVRAATGARHSAAEAWKPFEELLQRADDSPAASTGESKLSGGSETIEYFQFGSTAEFMSGLTGLSTGGLKRSMEEEARENEGGKWWCARACVCTILPSRGAERMFVARVER